MRVLPTWDLYRKGEYAAALAERAKLAKIDQPAGSRKRARQWDFDGYALEAAIYGQLGQKAEAEAAVAELLEAFPNFVDVELGRMTGFVWDQDAVEHLIDGLRKAGLDIPDEPAAAD
jgi:tetratricopeptide (TPR) repeat protein